MRAKHIATTCFLISALFLAIACFQNSWWGGESGGIGFLGITECTRTGEHCQRLSFSLIAEGKKPASEFREVLWCGRAAFLCTLLASIGSLAAAIGLMLAPPRNFYIVALPILAGAVAVLFLVITPEGFGALSFGVAFYLFWIGLSTSFAGFWLLSVAEIEEGAANDPAMFSPFTTEPGHIANHSAFPTKSVVPACPTCEAPTTWNERFSRFFCASCRQYLNQ